eukprot:364524-Chlamydomonas_euryale.AAC.6
MACGASLRRVCPRHPRGSVSRRSWSSARGIASSFVPQRPAPARSSSPIRTRSRPWSLPRSMAELGAAPLARPDRCSQRQSRARVSAGSFSSTKAAITLVITHQMRCASALCAALRCGTSMHRQRRSSLTFSEVGRKALRLSIAARCSPGPGAGGRRRPTVKQFRARLSSRCQCSRDRLHWLSARSTWMRCLAACDRMWKA